MRDNCHAICKEDREASGKRAHKNASVSLMSAGASVSPKKNEVGLKHTTFMT
jgi:hypothetical protein